MYLHIGHEEGSVYSLAAGNSAYAINEAVLLAMGFERNETLSDPQQAVYRYYRNSKVCNGVELIFEKEFGILSVEEFWLNKNDEIEYFSYTIVGKFRINSDQDLAFIFSRNIRLNYIFNIDGKRV